MRNVVALVVLLGLVALPALAGEGNVPQATLASLGLGDLKPMSDAEGMQVRGQSSSHAFVRITSLVFGQLLTPDTKNFLVNSSVSEVDANAETTASGETLTLSFGHGHGMDFSLEVTYPDTTTFMGYVFGHAGGGGHVSAFAP